LLFAQFAAIKHINHRCPLVGRKVKSIFAVKDVKRFGETKSFLLEKIIQIGNLVNQHIGEF